MTSPMIRIASPGPRERLAQDHRLGQAQLQADLADLVLEQVAQRLDELEPQVRRQAADVVVGLDLLGGLRLGRGRLDDVRVERPLGQEVDPAELGRLLLEDADELVADDPALLLGVLDAGEPGEEPLAGIDHDQVHPEVPLEGDAQQLRFLLAHQSVIDVDAGEPIADGPVDERGGHRRVDAARQGADDEAVRAGLRGVPVDPLADPGDRRVDEVRGRPGSARCRRCPVTKLRRTSRPRGVWTTSGWNWMPYRFRSGRRQAGVGRRVALGRRVEALGQSRDGVAVAHPDRLVAVDAGEQAVVGGDRDTLAGPYSRCVVGRTSPPSSWAIIWAP